MKKVFRGNLADNLKAVGVIMAGGSGTRFWPLSRKSCPKQFLNLTGTGGGRSLIQATADRLDQLLGNAGMIVVTAENQQHLVAKQLPEIAILSEPSARNTAACLAYAAALTLSKVGDLPMICVPADHMIWGEDELTRIYCDAIELAAKEDVLITIGIKPTIPETGYGYVKKADSISKDCFKVDRFVEKPDFELAQEYCRSGEFFWNSGMFIWRPSVLLAAFEKYLPQLAAGIKKIQALLSSDISEEEKYVKVKEIYLQFESISIDYAIMEKADNVRMFISGDSIHWNDVGSWSSWVDIEKNNFTAEGNFVDADAILIDTKNTAILSKTSIKTSKLIAAVGLEDLIVVETDDAILICKRGKAQDVKKVVDILKEKSRDDLL